MKTRQGSATMNAIITASSPSVPSSSRPSRQRSATAAAAAPTATATAAAAATVVTPEKSRKRKSSNDTPSSSKRTRQGGNQNAKAPPKITPTKSFPVCWAGNSALTKSIQPVVEPHTLILGTHPGVKSLSGDHYYAHSQNDFWWIAGDCLGFRRDTGRSKSSGEPFAIAEWLLHDESKIVPYDEQVAILVSRGFALWDVIESCEREGSSKDSKIRKERPNDIFGFCQAHPSIRRLIFTNASKKVFAKYFPDWLSSGQLVPYGDEESQQQALTSISVNGEMDDDSDTVTSKKGWTSNHAITVVSIISVSSAATEKGKSKGETYGKKRDSWEEHVYRPGLALLREQYPSISG